MEFTPAKLNLFTFFKLPSAFWSGVRVKSISPEVCEVTVKHRWFNQNPFNSMYFAVQAMAAEFTTGAEDNVLIPQQAVLAAVNDSPVPIFSNPQIMAVDVGLKHDKAVWILHDMTQMCLLDCFKPLVTGKVETPDISRKTAEMSDA
jgi:hypothetical protein